MSKNLRREAPIVERGVETLKKSEAVAMSFDMPIASFEWRQVAWYSNGIAQSSSSSALILRVGAHLFCNRLEVGD